MATKMRDLIILLPGIMGSVLQKDGKDVWALSGQAIWQHLKKLGSSVNQLQIVQENWRDDDLGDGIQAVRLIEDLHSIPFLVEHAGYSVIIRRIKEYFDVKEGSLHDPHDDENFFTFPYDWRRDNRASARKLQAFIEKQLPAWRKKSGAKDAQVILIGHSMGGLISRYYLEVMGGWHDCRALITVGSPHRGAIKAVNLVSNGLLFSSLTDVVRTLRSAYQIMPTYPAVEVDGRYVRISETDAVPNIDQQLAKRTREEFLEAIYQAAMQNRKDPDYQQRTIPWIGFQQDTMQSARLINGKLVVGYEPPAGVDQAIADGDGTVPRVSALPADLEGPITNARFAVERHGWLTNNEMSLQPLLATIATISAPGAPGLHGMQRDEARPSIKLRLESLFMQQEPVTMQVQLVSLSDEPQDLRIKVKPVGRRGTRVTQEIEANNAEATLVEFGELLPGLYEVTAGPQKRTSKAAAPTHGVFEVVDQTALS